MFNKLCMRCCCCCCCKSCRTMISGFPPFAASHHTLQINAFVLWNRKFHSVYKTFLIKPNGIWTIWKLMLLPAARSIVNMVPSWCTQVANGYSATLSYSAHTHTHFWPSAILHFLGKQYKHRDAQLYWTRKISNFHKFFTMRLYTTVCSAERTFHIFRQSAIHIYWPKPKSICQFWHSTNSLHCKQCIQSWKRKIIETKKKNHTNNQFSVQCSVFTP